MTSQNDYNYFKNLAAKSYNIFTVCLTILGRYALNDQRKGTAKKMKFSTKDFFIRYDQIRRKVRIWSHLLKKSLMRNFIFCAMYINILHIFNFDYMSTGFNFFYITICIYPTRKVFHFATGNLT